MTFTYTPAEESAWLALKPMLATAQGQLNPDLAREYIRAANAGLPSYDTSRDYSYRLLALTVLPYSFLLKLKPTAIVASV